MNEQDLHFKLFAAAMHSFSGFAQADSREQTPFDAWKNIPPPPKQSKPRKYAMIDPPKIEEAKTKYSQVERRSVFECGNSQHGLVVQLEVHSTPVRERRAAVYVQSKDYRPSSWNIGNVTFKFAKNKEGFFIEIRQKDAVKALKKKQPRWLSLRNIHIHGQVLKIDLGPLIGPILVQRLLLLADFCGQARAQGSTKVERNPGNFHPPAAIDT